MIKMFKNSKKIKILEAEVKELVDTSRYLNNTIERMKFEFINPPKYKLGDKIKGGVIYSVECKRNFAIPRNEMFLWEYKAIIGNKIIVFE